VDEPKVTDKPLEAEPEMENVPPEEKVFAPGFVIVTVC
jgi:hypothetical protein